jgi:hypothetical protein
VVTGEASAPPSVIFVAPDEVSTIWLSTTPVDLTRLDPALKAEQRQITLTDGATVYAVLNASAENWDALVPVFNEVVASLGDSQ